MYLFGMTGPDPESYDRQILCLSCYVCMYIHVAAHSQEQCVVHIPTENRCHVYIQCMTGECIVVGLAAILKPGLCGCWYAYCLIVCITTLVYSQCVVVTHPVQ